MHKLWFHTRALLAVALSIVTVHSVKASPGASVPWTTYEAEAMTINGGVILGPPPVAVNKDVTVTNTFAGESSGQQCVELQTQGSYVQFTAQEAANALVVRYSVPDTTSGTGANYTISLYTNGVFSQEIPVTSMYSWLYGSYPWSATSSSGSPRNFFDEARVMNLSIKPGDQIRLQIGPSDTASFYVIDLVDLENVAPALTQPANSLSVKSAPYNATGNGTSDDTSAIQDCINDAESQGKIVWIPPGHYMVDADLVVANVTIQGAGMWYTTLVGNPSVYNSNANARIRFDGNGSSINLYDFAIVGCLNYRNDSEANDGFQGFYGTNSSIQRCWVEHTKTGCWIANAQGMLISGCRVRDTIADGINLCVGCNSCIVSNCATRGTGDDSFGIWPAAYTTEEYQAGYNLITQCTAQSPWFANGSGIYGAIDNQIQNCLFQDTCDGCGVLVAGTFPQGSNDAFAGITIVQNCTLNRCGGYDPGWQWRGALTVVPQDVNITGLQINNLNISNSFSYGVQFPDPGSGVLSNAAMSGINVSGYATQVAPYHPQNVSGTNVYVDGVFGVLGRSDALGGITVSDLSINGSNIISLPYPATTNVTYPYPGTFIANQSSSFTFTFLTTPINVTVQTVPAGYSFTVDGTNYIAAQTFNWTQGSAHTLATVTPQNTGAGVQSVWTSWSDGGAISHTIEPLASATYTANFTNQYYLTMNEETGGSASPGSGWFNGGTVVTISATPATGYNFDGWTGSGNGSYSGGNISASISMNGPITETANFSTPLVNSMAWLQQPDNVSQGAIIVPEVQVLAMDANGQPLAGAGITLSLGSGTGTLSGTLARTTGTNGIASFNDLSFNQPGPKTLTAAALTGSATNSASFMVIGSVAALAFTAQPGAAFAGERFGFQPVLETVDAFGNPTTTGLPATLPVVVGLTNGSGVLMGTTQYDIGTGSSNGVVTFDDLAISAAGAGNQLTASAASTAVTNPVPGAVLWLDASDPTTLTTNGTQVQAWKNKGTGGAGVSGTNLWFTQNTAALQPWLTNQFDGKPVITFSKKGNGYSAGCTYLGNIGQNSYTNSGSQMTYFVVARQSEDSIGWQGPVSFSTNGQTDGQGAAGVVVLADGSQSAPYPFGIQRDHPGTPMQADVAAPPVGTPFVWSFVDNAGTASLSVIQSTGQSAASTANIVNGISPYKYNVTDVTIGGRLEPAPSTVDNGWDGDVAEVLVYNTALSAAQCASVESYLTNKWFAPTPPGLGSALSAAFTVQSPGAEPPQQRILGVTVNAGVSSVMLNYAATPGFSYCLETTTNLSSASWTIVAGSATNATGNVITFVIPAAGRDVQRYYRTASP